MTSPVDGDCGFWGDFREICRKSALATFSVASKKVEMRFAHLETHHKFERMRLRGLFDAHDEFHLAAIVENFQTMALRAVGLPFKQMGQSTA